ncbi:hypothetical protein GGS21DRAFT_522126 [Xylaria nigripes]|nr:hypothetical protein GGS21DRAFT_522126 [Xylaria nigripes]
MAPNFRQNTQTRRGNRSGYVDHDDFEGLPLRQWRQEWVIVTPPPPPDPSHKNDIWAIELPHGMPKDSHLLPAHTQDLLRAARSGRLYKRPAPAEEEEAEPDPAISEKAEKKEEDLSSKGFRIKVWKQVPRSAEGPTISHLAKRRKGTVTLSSSLPAGAAPGPTITKATVRRIDAAGNPYTQEVTLSEGQPVDGEIISTTVVAAPNPSLSRDTSAAVTPVRRRPPPPKRKPRGPGRGRRRKLPLPAHTHSNVANPATTGLAQGVRMDVAQQLKPEDDASKQNDSEMAEDDEGEDGEDGEDEGEEGEDDDEDGDGADGETRSISRANSETRSDQMDITPTKNQGEVATGVAHPPPSQELSSSSSVNLSVPQQPPSHVEGSPLKQVVLAQSPASSIHDSPSQEFVLNPPATLDDAEPMELAATESAPESAPATNADTFAAPSEDNVMPTTDEDTEMFMDFKMANDPIEFTEQLSETEPLADIDRSVSMIDTPTTALVQPVDSGDPFPAGFAVSNVIANEASGEIGLIAPDEGQGPKDEDATDAELSSERAAQNDSDRLAAFPRAPAEEGSFADQSAPTTGLAGSQDLQAAPQTQEENTPNSPDLFSGLEAALNEDGPDSDAPAPQTSESTAS